MFASEAPKTILDPVMDIVDDNEDILKNMGKAAASEPAKAPENVKVSDLVTQVNKGNG